MTILVCFGMVVTGLALLVLFERLTRSHDPELTDGKFEE